MNATRGAVVFLSIMVMMAAPVFSEVTVSVTLTGPIDELVPLLQQLREAGAGDSEGESSLKIEMHSSESMEATGSESAPVAGAVQSEQPTPEAVPVAAGLALLDPKVEPATASLGQSVLISVRVSDLERRIDTVAATIEGMAVPQDLYDNGTRGDVAANDGIWSAAVTLGSQLSPGQHRIGIYAFDRNGGAVTITAPDGNPVPVSAQTTIEIMP